MHYMSNRCKSGMHEMYCFSNYSLFFGVAIGTWLGSPLTLSGIHLFWMIVRFAGLNSFLYVIAKFILSDLHVDLSLVGFTLPGLL